MTVDEIKKQYSMLDVVNQYGIQPNRAGFISCPFHKEKTASMKIYADSFYCFGCGKSGDIFSFVQNMNNCDFKTAFYTLGGQYQKTSTKSKLAIYHAEKARGMKQKKEEKIKAEMKYNDTLIGIYVTWLKRLEPLTDDWCDCMNAYMLCIGRDEYLQEELKKI